MATKPAGRIWRAACNSRFSCRSNPDNARELMEQWTTVHDIDQVPDVEDHVKGFPHRVYRDANGNARVETYAITGMDHGVPIDPGPGAEQCGRPGAHAFAVGVCASYYIARFWGLAP